MSGPTRWNEDPQSPPPLALALGLEEGSRPLEPMTPAAQAAVWQAVKHRAAQPPFNWDWILAPVLAVAVSLLVVVLWLPRAHKPETPRLPLSSLREHEAETSPQAAPRQVAIGAIAQLEVTPGAVVEVPPLGARSTAGYRMSLTSGRFCAHVEPRDVAVEGPFVVNAPGLSVVVIGTRFCMEAASDVTTVSVTEGRVRVERPRLAAAFVGAGESLSIESPSATRPSATPAPTVSPVQAAPTDPVARCATVVNLSRRADCYAALVGTDDLAAQNALFSLALLSRDGLHDGPAALSHFRTYLVRFPDGVLAAEARQNLITELFDERRFGEASSEAERYLKTYPWDGRAAEVALLRAGLLRGDPAHARAALAAYRDILGREAPAAVRDDALYGAIVSGFDAGEVAQARADVARYLTAFPLGRHRAEVEGLRSR